MEKIFNKVCRLGIQRLTAFQRQVFGYLPPNRTYKSPCIRLSIKFSQSTLHDSELLRYKIHI